MKNLPLKWRLSLPICLVVLFTIVTVSIVAYIELKESLLRNIDPTLRAMVEGIVSEFDKTVSHEAYQATFRSITGNAGQSHSNLYRIWMDGSNLAIFTSDTSSDTQDRLLVNLPYGIQPGDGEYVFFNLDHEGRKYRAVWVRRPFEKGVANILVAGSSGFVYHEMEEFLWVLLILGGSLVVGSFLLVPAIVGWGIHPIDDIAAVLHEVTAENMEQETLHNLKVPQELMPFVEALDGMLIRLDKAMKKQKQFIADASHELRTPLAVIKSTIQTTKMVDRDIADYNKALDDTLHDVNRLEQLIEHLLSLAQVGEGVSLSNVTCVDLYTLLVNLAENFDARASQQGGKVICENCLPAQVNGDERELNQLFSNILDNAIKYGPPKGIIHITLEHETNGYATVCIHDQGGKIPSEDLPCLFDRFYRVDSSRSRATGGSGLGLAIAKEIVDRHNGRIEITSDVHTGTSVFVRLPRS